MPVRFLASVLLTCAFFNFSYADTIYLKNGRSISGIIKKDDGKTVELEVGVSSSVSFLKSEIENIIKAPGGNSAALRKRWEEQKKSRDDYLAGLQPGEGPGPNSAKFSHDPQGMVVNVLLNNKVNARMVLDTGASAIIITKKVADDLGINLDSAQPDMKAQVADGRKVSARRVQFDTVQVEDAEAKGVEGAVLLDDAKDPGFGDGLLGMSFLKRFNFKIDQKEKKLILEKL